jgi:hypothetical protein
MPTIPRLERRTVTPSSRVSSVSTPDISSVGTALGGAIERVRDKRTQYELADARSKLSILSHQQNNAYDNDDDYETIGERWDQSMSKGVDDIASGISDPEARNFFMMDARERVEASRPRINAVAFSKERDVKRADMNKHLNGLREIVMGDDIEAAQQAISDAKDLYDGAAAAGYVGHEEGVKTIELWKQDSAIGRVRKVAPKDRTKLLKDPVITANIPSDKLAELQREADDAVLDEQAMELVDGMGIGFTTNDVLRQARTIDDPELRIKFETRAHNEHAKQKTGEREAMEDFHQKWFVPLATGKMELDTNDEQFRQLDPDLQASLMKVDSVSKTPPRARSNPKIIKELMELQAEKDFTRFREVVNTAVENGELSPADTAKFVKVGINGEKPEEWDSDLTLMQRVESKLSSYDKKYTDKQVYNVLDKVNNWDKWYLGHYGKAADDSAIEKKIADAIMEVELDPTAVFTSKEQSKYYDLDYEGQVELFSETFDNPTEVKDDQFNLVFNESITESGPRVDREGRPTRMRALENGLKYNERLSDDNQALLISVLKKEEKEAVEFVRDSLQKKLNRMPSAQEFLTEWWNLHDKPKQ